MCVCACVCVCACTHFDPALVLGQIDWQAQQTKISQPIHCLAGQRTGKHSRQRYHSYPRLGRTKNWQAQQTKISQLSTAWQDKELTNTTKISQPIHSLAGQRTGKHSRQRYHSYPQLGRTKNWQAQQTKISQLSTAWQDKELASTADKDITAIHGLAGQRTGKHSRQRYHSYPQLGRTKN